MVTTEHQYDGGKDEPSGSYAPSPQMVRFRGAMYGYYRTPI